MSSPATILRENELTRLPLSLVDETGAVFSWQGKILRAIRPEAEARVRALLASGLLEALAERGWIPPWQVATVRIEGAGLVLEQQLLPVVSYPYEWTYGMLRDAGIRVLEINALARNYGWELKDSHGFNLVFDGSRPLWVDLGSFVPCAKEIQGWLAYEQFLFFYEYPLRIWREGGGFVGRRLVAASHTMTHADFGLYRWPWLRIAGVGLYQKSLTWWYNGYRHLSRVPEAKIRSRLPGLVGAMLCELRARRCLPWQELPLGRLGAKLASRRRRGPGGFWSDYQASGAAFVATPRFRRIAELLRTFNAGSVIELGGNQGRFGEELLRQGVVRSALCTDADELAVDRAYERTKTQGGLLHTAVLDFASPMVSPCGISPATRLRAEAALALAVSHHLLLTDGISVRQMFAVIAAYSQRLVFVEFMPLGLWDGKQAPPVPDWYRLDWFRREFSNTFELLHEEALEENRHLFCGALRS